MTFLKETVESFSIKPTADARVEELRGYGISANTRFDLTSGCWEVYYMEKVSGQSPSSE